MNGLDVMKSLKKRFATETDAELAERLGVTIQSIQKWNKQPSLTSRQIANIVHKAHDASKKYMEQKTIRPLVEFFSISKYKNNKYKKTYSLFNTIDENGMSLPYMDGLQKEMDRAHGVYIFFDSRGQSIYAGKARKQTLWKEMNSAFNRPRTGVQKIKRVRHPTRKQKYESCDEKARQIKEIAVPLHELASYFSAYEVTDTMINDLEALLVRSSANDLLNTRMEIFGHQKNTKSTAVKKKAKK